MTTSTISASARMSSRQLGLQPIAQLRTPCAFKLVPCAVRLAALARSVAQHQVAPVDGRRPLAFSAWPRADWTGRYLRDLGRRDGRRLGCPGQFPLRRPFRSCLTPADGLRIIAADDGRRTRRQAEPMNFAGHGALGNAHASANLGHAVAIVPERPQPGDGVVRPSGAHSTPRQSRHTPQITNPPHTHSTIAISATTTVGGRLLRRSSSSSVTVMHHGHEQRTDGSQAESGQADVEHGQGYEGGGVRAGHACTGWAGRKTPAMISADPEGSMDEETRQKLADVLDLMSAVVTSAAKARAENHVLAMLLGHLTGRFCATTDDPDTVLGQIMALMQNVVHGSVSDPPDNVDQAAIKIADLLQHQAEEAMHLHLRRGREPGPSRL